MGVEAYAELAIGILIVVVLIASMAPLISSSTGTAATTGSGALNGSSASAKALYNTYDLFYALMGIAVMGIGVLKMFRG